MDNSARLPVRERWFERREVAPGVTWILEPGVHPFLRANIWHVRGRDRDLVVDTGMGIASLHQAFPDLLGGEHVAFVTHGHYDHTGGAHAFSQVLCHEREAAVLREPEDDTLVTGDLSQAFTAALAADDPSGVIPPYLVDSVPDSDFSVSSYTVRPVSDPVVVTHGDVIDLGDRAFEVIHLPGHTPGSAALFEAATGTVFTGDVLYDGELLDELPESDVGDYVRSMRRLVALDVRVAYPGHEQPLSGADVRRLAASYLTKRQG